MNPVSNPIDVIRADSEECEAAVLQALAAMDGNDVQEQMEAFNRFRQIFKKTSNWTGEQKFTSARYLAERGRIEAGDWEAVVDAMNEFMGSLSPRPAR